ncbi:MAG: hypothetical protein QOE70_415 [Chthoniobacter sp.]|jgi:hypothetical protein|nr:hypothetical protein [Chthoniobacter sp.]
MKTVIADEDDSPPHQRNIAIELIEELVAAEDRQRSDGTHRSYSTHGTPGIDSAMHSGFSQPLPKAGRLAPLQRSSAGRHPAGAATRPGATGAGAEPQRPEALMGAGTFL